MSPFLRDFPYTFPIFFQYLSIWQHEFCLYEQAQPPVTFLEKNDDLCWRSWSWILAEDHDPGRGSWSWQRMLILADDHGRGSWSWQKNMFLLKQHDSAGKQKTTLQGPRWDHLGTIFDKVRKLISRRLGIDLGSILLLEAGLYSKFYTATKCRPPYIHMYIYIIQIILCVYIWLYDIC